MSAISASDMYVPAAQGQKISFMGMDLIWKITSAMSRGAYVAFVHVVPPGTGVPMHIHHNDEESIFVVEGQVVVRVDGETFEMGPGDMVNMPRGTPHGFRATGDSPARALFTIDLALTSDYETMFAGMVGLAPTDLDRLRTLCAANGCEVLFPPVMP
jgi:quercetin dioxygenase-like cupin family protein